MIIDIHAHAFPDELAPRAVAVLSERSMVTPHTDGTCEGLRESMRKAGVDISVVMPIATKPAQARSINQWAAMVSRDYDDLICFGSLHPKQDDLQAEVDRMVADGLIGVKLHPDYQDFFVDDPDVTSMYRAIADAGLVLLFHAGIDIGLPPPVHCTPERLARVLDAVPDLTVIAAHMGGYKLWDDVLRCLAGRRLYLDTSYTLADLGSERMTELIQAHGSNQVLFGSDSPWTDPSTELAAIRALPLSKDDIAAITGGNARRVLGISG